VFSDGLKAVFFVLREGATQPAEQGQSALLSECESLTEAIELAYPQEIKVMVYDEREDIAFTTAKVFQKIHGVEAVSALDLETAWQSVLSFGAQAVILRHIHPAETVFSFIKRLEEQGFGGLYIIYSGGGTEVDEFKLKNYFSGLWRAGRLWFIDVNDIQDYLYGLFGGHNQRVRRENSQPRASSPADDTRDEGRRTIDEKYLARLAQCEILEEAIAANGLPKMVWVEDTIIKGLLDSKG